MYPAKGASPLRLAASLLWAEHRLASQLQRQAQKVAQKPLCKDNAVLSLSKSSQASIFKANVFPRASGQFPAGLRLFSQYRCIVIESSAFKTSRRKTNMSDHLEFE